MGPTAVAPPSLDPSSAAATAMKSYDKNNDGKLDATELPNVPALKKHLADYDGDKDGNLTAAEITARISATRKMNVGLLPLRCTVTMDGKPLEGAKVDFVPEEFMGGAIQPASGMTDAQGMASMGMPLDKLPGGVRGAYAHEGVYKVKISHPTIKIPPKYNEATTLGHEVVQGVRDQEGVKFDLTSK